MMASAKLACRTEVLGSRQGDGRLPKLGPGSGPDHVRSQVPPRVPGLWVPTVV